MDSPFPPAPELRPEPVPSPTVNPVSAASARPMSAPSSVQPPPAPPPPPVYITQSPPPPPRSSGCLWAFAIIVTIVLLGSLFMNFVLAVGSSVGSVASLSESGGLVKGKRKFSESLEQEGTSGRTKDRIVRIDVDGIIMSGSMGGGFFGSSMPMVDAFKRQMEQALKDNNVKAIVLRVNSPGGEVTASDTMYNVVKEAVKKKPVVVFMDSLAASGGYYLSCPATKIIATETTLTGSIGVIMESMSYHGLFDKVGLGMNTFTSGPMKDSLNGARPMRDDEKVYIQSLVNSMYDRFLTVVSEGRKIPKETLRTGVADGRVVTGKDALAAKLVDQIGYIETAYDEARKLGKAEKAMVVKYSHEPTVLDLFNMEAGSQAKDTKVELQLPGASALPKLMPGRMYYLPSTLAQ